jgi:hypothetical protein
VCSKRQAGSLPESGLCAGRFPIKQNRGKDAAFCDCCLRLELKMLSGLYNRPDALRAQNLANLTPIFHHQHLLKVRAEGAVGRPQREAAIVPEGCGFATVFTLCHCQNFLS